MLYATLISMVTGIFFLGVGILIGSICNEKSVGGIASIVVTGQSLLSGMWFPLEGLDETIVKIMDYLPFKNTTILIQNTLNGFNDIYSDFICPLIIVFIYGIVIFFLAIIIYKKKMKTK